VCLVRERGESGWSEPIPVAVWLEDKRVGLAPGWNIPLRCGLDSSVKNLADGAAPAGLAPTKH